MATTADFRNGLCLYYQERICTIVSFQHVKPGKGAAFVRTKLKNIQSGRIIEHTFNAGVRIDTARVERRVHQFLYKDGEDFHFMDSNSYEQLVLPVGQVPDADLLKEGQERIDVLFHVEKEQVLSCELPPVVELKITYTEPALRGDTANNTLKPATLETGATLKVPLFVTEGTSIKVDVRNRKYAGKVS